MVREFINKAFWLSVLILLQVLILNYINIYGYGVPLLYVYFILKLDSSISRNSLLLWGFFLGLITDVFCDTLGMHTVVTVFIAFIRPYFLNFFKPNDIEEVSIIPSFSSIGVWSFIKYAFYLLLMHHTLFYMVEYFSFYPVGIMISTLSSVVSSLFFIICIEFVRR